MNSPNSLLLNIKCLTLFARYSIISHSSLVSAFSTSEIYSKWTHPTGYNTGIKIYNPITKSKVPFIIQNKHFLKWYACGPTVYDSPHIGHAVNNVKLDIIRRILENFFHIDTMVVASVTDIDDKIINKAISLKQDFRSIAKTYELEYLEAMEQFGILEPTRHAKVTDFIPRILDFTENLVNTNQAYVGKDGSVYFDVEKFPHYFKLWGKPDNISAHKVKKSSLDFALWKRAKENEPHFDSQFGKGRPGWHIECSAMASHFFGSTVDLHTGGIDLKFPHHENEEAQSCAFHQCSQWVNYWLHTGHLRGKDGTKMSKSLGNFVTIKDYLEKHTPNQLRMMCLLSPYASDMDYNEGALLSAQQVSEKFRTFVETTSDYMKEKIQFGNVNSEQMFDALEKSKQTVREIISDDFNTPKVIEHLLHLVHTANAELHNSRNEKTVGSTLFALNLLSNYVSNILNLFGLNLSPNVASQKSVGAPNVIESKVNALLDSAVNFRRDVRKIAIDLKKEKVNAGNVLSKCDEFRNELLALGVQINDQKNNEATWQFKHKTE